MHSIIRWIDRVSLGISGLTLILMMVLISLDALMRYGMNRSLAGVDGLTSEFFMPTVVYLAAAYVYSSGANIRATILSDQLPKKIQVGIFIIFDAIGAFVFALICYGVWIRAYDSYISDEYSTNTLGYILAPSFAVVAFGCTLLLFRMIIAIVTLEPPTSEENLDV
jgi:TRAP-type C4-dicarboxylate transport system permease small subunit